MNKTNFSGCEKIENLWQVGMEGSIADYKNKLNECFQCYNFLSCEKSNSFLSGILKQKENLKSLERIGNLRK